MKVAIPFITAVAFGPLLLTVDRWKAQETIMRGGWVDSYTGLMWAEKDNGRRVKWRAAKKYCRDLRLGGNTDWRLPKIYELQTISDKSVESPGVNPPSHRHAAEPITYHVKGNLFLTGDEWSSTQRMDDRGRPTGLVWYWDFLNGIQKDEDTSFMNLWGGMPEASGLCVRRYQK
jgi:hypothetical protein